MATEKGINAHFFEVPNAFAHFVDEFQQHCGANSNHMHDDGNHSIIESERG